MLPLVGLLPFALSLAPEIFRFLSGDKAEKITKEVVDVIQTITGVSTPEKLAEVIASDPHKTLELKVALAKIASEAQAIESQERIEALKADFADMANARAQTLALAASGSKISWAAPVISIVVVLGFFLVPVVSKYLNLLTDQIWLGALIGAFTSVVSYWIGSSASGRRSQEAVEMVAQRSADQVNEQAKAATKAKAIVPTPAPVVVVPPIPAPIPAPVAPSPAPPVVVATPTIPPAPVPSVAWRQGPYGGARWQVGPQGVLVEGEATFARSGGEPVTIRKIWTNYGDIISEVCGRLGVPAEIVVAVIATESKGIADAIYVEPDGRASGGLMQVLNTTGSEILKRTVTANDLKDPTLNINAGVTYILSQKIKNNYFDPILTAAAYNAGGIYEPRAQDNNRFRLRSTGDHLERMIRWYGDACFCAKQDGWFK